MHKHNAKAKAVPSGASTVTESKLELGTTIPKRFVREACSVASHAASMSARRARARRIYGRIFRI